MQYVQGLVQKFKLDRPPTDIELAAKLDIKQQVSEQADGTDSLLTMNNCYLEVADPYSGMKGFVESFLFFCLCLFSIFLPIKIIPIAIDQWNNLDTEKNFMWHFGYGFFFILATVVFFIFCKLISYNCFSYKNWPTRFNRRTGMVYVFNSNRKGKILIAPWNRIFFYITGDSFGETQACLRGYILDEAGIIRDGFAFGWNVASGTDKTLLLQQWEFIRRYMEDGPEQLPLPLRYVDPDPGLWASIRNIHLSLPLLTYMGILGLLLIAGILAGHFHARAAYIAGVVFTAFGFGPGLFRYLTYKTSRAPQWPAEVEAACQVEPNDPYLHPRAGDKVY